MLRFATRSVIAMSALSVTTAASAEFLIVRATGPTASHFPAGGRLPDEAIVVLVEGDRLTLANEAGTKTFTGPGNFSVLYNPDRRGRTRGVTFRGPGAAPPPSSDPSAQGGPRERFILCPGNRRCPG